MADNTKIGIEITATSSQFQREIQKVVSGAQQAANRLKSSFSGVQKTLGALGVGFSAVALGSWAKDVVSSAAALDDLADSTGSTVENLSKLANQAKVSGTDFGTLQSLVLKLTAGMAGVEEEGSNVGRALKALGVDARDPVDALQQVAVALNKYSDGVGKAALARDLFGKGGPAFLATLKDIAETQDIAATVTAKQAAEAENLEKAFRRMSVEATAVKDAILNGLVPGLTRMIEEMREGIRIAGSFGSALLNFGSINTFKTVEENLRDTEERIANITAGSGSAEARWLSVLGISDEVVARLRQRREFLRFQQTQAALAGAAALGDLSDQVSRATGRKPKLDYTGASPKTGRSAAAMSEAERYLENLQRQLDRTKDLTVAEQVLSDIQSGRLKLSASVSQEQLLGVARQIDAANALKKADEERLKTMEEEARIRERTSQANTKAIEAQLQEVDQLAEGNAALKDEIALIGADSLARLELAKARIDSAIALKEDTVAMLANAGGSEAQIAAIQQQINLLKERKGLITQQGISEQLLDDAMRIKEINDIFVDSFADALTAVTTKTKSISDAVKDMERQIVASISRIASQKIAESLFGSSGTPGGGQGMFADIGKWLFSAFGGSAQGFAMGGSPPVGRISVVGERGPELFVPRTSGVIIPNDVFNARRNGRQPANNVSVTVNVLPGASRVTADQAALRTGVEVQRALARNG